MRRDSYTTVSVEEDEETLRGTNKISRFWNRSRIGILAVLVLSAVALASTLYWSFRTESSTQLSNNPATDQKEFANKPTLPLAGAAQIFSNTLGVSPEHFKWFPGAENAIDGSYIEENGGMIVMNHVERLNPHTIAYKADFVDVKMKY